jgi:hypothetical protein
MPRSNRGGRRDGAGRKKLLTEEQRVILGTVTAGLLRERTNASADAKFAAQHADTDLEYLWTRLHAVPPENRKKPEGQDRLSIWLDDIEEEIRSPPLRGRRWERGPLIAAKRMRLVTFRDVAKEASQHWGLKITSRMVKRCLDEFEQVMAADDALTASQPKV